MMILQGFRRLLAFSGRDTRRQFWPYALTIFVLMNLGLAATFLPFFVQMTTRVQQFAATHPDQAHVTQSVTSYSIAIDRPPPQLFSGFEAVAHQMGGVIAVAAVLWAAAVTRRLHDRGRTGLWGLPPLLFVGFGLWEMPKVLAMMGDAQTVPPMFFAVFLNNLLYMASLVWLVVLLCGATDPGANRFGEAPSGSAAES